MKKSITYLLFFCFVSLRLTAQNTKINDSLKSQLNLSKSDTTKVILYHKLYQSTDSIAYSEKGLALAEKINYKKGISLSSLTIGRFYYFEGKLDVSLKSLLRAIQVAEEIQDKKVLVSAYRYIGYLYREHDSFNAEEFYKKSLTIAKELKDKIAASYAYSALGNISEGTFQGASVNNKKALAYYLKSLEIREQLGSDEEIAASLNETSRVYDLLGMLDKGLELKVKGLAIAEKAGSIENVIYLSSVLGNEYSMRLKDYKKGLEYQLKAYELGKSQKNNFDVMHDISRDIAQSYANLADFKQAIKFYQLSNDLNDSIKAQRNKNDYHLSEMKHNLEIELQKQKSLLRDSEILNAKAESARQTTIKNAILIGFLLTLLLAFIMYRGNRQKQRLNKDLEATNKEINEAYITLAESKNKFKLITDTINDLFYLYNIVEKKYEFISPNCIALLGLSQQEFYDGKSGKTNVYKEDLPLVVDANVKIDMGIAYDIEYRILLDGQIKWMAEKSSPIYDEHGILKRNSGICRDITDKKSNEEKIKKNNKDINDSILYAKSIQDAILIPKETIAKKLSDFFIFSSPKDIVSGDFYFYKETKNGIIIAVADCTGHGVPAGFLSMIGHAYLNEIINVDNEKNPAQILDQLNDIIIKSLNQKRANSESKDGMDISILLIEENKMSVQYAGANTPLYHVRKGELIEYEADLFPIGIHVLETTQPFTNNKFDLQKGDSLYIFTDGYSDQFGEKLGKKYSRNKFKELLLSINNQKMPQQKEVLKESMEAWKGGISQTDDILIFGLKL